MHINDELLEAVRACDLDVVDELLDDGADVNASDEDGHTPLMEAAAAGDLAIIDLLLERGGDPNLWGQGDNVLTHAAKSGNREVVEFLRPLVSEEIRESVTEDSLRREELRKAREPDIGIESFILDAGMGREQLVQEAIVSGVNIDAFGSTGQTALHYASYYGHVPIVELLLQNGAEVNAPTEPNASLGREGETALCFIAGSSYAENHEKVIELLVEAGANVDVQDANGATPLMKAIDSGFAYPNAVRALLQAGADTQLKDKVGRTALDMATTSRPSDFETLKRNKLEIENLLRSHISSVD